LNKRNLNKIRPVIVNIIPLVRSGLPIVWKSKNVFPPPPKPKLSRKPNSKRFIEAMRKKLFLDEKIQLYIN
tara:strand:+ start:1668 stop:1880 length:213 start_codon:yes stop_codon:yes gene_type:complete